MLIRPYLHVSPIVELVMLLQTCFHFVATQISQYWFSHGSPFYQPFFQVIIPHHSKHDDKPTQPYIDQIGKAIFSSPQQKLVLSGIYDIWVHTDKLPLLQEQRTGMEELYPPQPVTE